MSIIVNRNGTGTKHNINECCAFIDAEEQFYLIDGATDSIVCIQHSGCTVYDTIGYDSIEDFLDTELGTELVKVYQAGSEYEIIVNG